MEIFARATRQKVRIKSDKGLITPEDLWDLDETTLDALYSTHAIEKSSKNVNSLISKPTREDALLNLKLDMIRFVFEVKMSDKETAALRAENKARRERLDSLIHDKLHEKDMSKPLEELLKEREALG